MSPCSNLTRWSPHGVLRIFAGAGALSVDGPAKAIEVSAEDRP